MLSTVNLKLIASAPKNLLIQIISEDIGSEDIVLAEFNETRFKFVMANGEEGTISYTEMFDKPKKVFKYLSKKLGEQVESSSENKVVSTPLANLAGISTSQIMRDSTKLSEETKPKPRDKRLNILFETGEERVIAKMFRCNLGDFEEFVKNNKTEIEKDKITNSLCKNILDKPEWSIWVSKV